MKGRLFEVVFFSLFGGGGGELCEEDEEEGFFMYLFKAEERRGGWERAGKKRSYLPSRGVLHDRRIYPYNRLFL